MSTQNDLLPAQWETPRLHVRNGRPEDAATLLRLFNANVAVAAWDPTFAPTTLDVIQHLLAMSGAGVQERGLPYQLQLFHLKEPAATPSGEPVGLDSIVGYTHTTYGMPRPGIAWINMFVLHPTAHKGGYAREVMEGQRTLWAALPGIDRAWAEVWLKNWPALRFWIANGFTTIVEWDGASVMTDDASASLVLETRWRPLLALDR